LNREDVKYAKELKKNPFISLLCALRAFAVRLFRQPLAARGETNNSTLKKIKIPPFTKKTARIILGIS